MKAKERFPDALEAFNTAIIRLQRGDSFKGHTMSLHGGTIDGTTYLALTNQYWNDVIYQTFNSKRNTTKTEITFQMITIPKWYTKKWSDIQHQTGFASAEYMADNIAIDMSPYHRIVKIHISAEGLAFNRHDQNIDLLKSYKHLAKKVTYNFKNSDISQWSHLADNENSLILPKNIIQ